MKKGLAAAFLAVLCTFLFYGIRYMRSPLLTQKAVYGTYEESVSTSCFFAREENVYSAQSSGTVYNNYSDGTRINKNASVAAVYSGDVSEENMQSLSTIDRKIENAKSMSSAVVSGAGEDDASLENRIDGYKYEIINASVKGDLSEVERYKEAINNLRGDSSSDPSADLISRLEREKSECELKIGGSKEEIVANEAGIFSTVLDGMEHILTPERVKEITVDEYDALTAPKEKTANSVVTTGDSVCKIVNNHQWYVVCAVAEERLSEVNVNSRVSMRFDNIPGVDVSGKIVYISEPKDGRCILTIETSQYVESAYSMRTSPMELVFKSYSGYKIPIYALRTENGVRGVVGRRQNVDAFYPCDVVYTNEEAEYVIIKTPENAERKLENADEFVIGER